MTFGRDLLLFLLLTAFFLKAFSAPINDNLESEDLLDAEESDNEDTNEESGDDDLEGSGVKSELAEDKSLNESGTNKNKSSIFRKVSKRSNLLADIKRVEKKNLEAITKKDENAQARTGCGCCCNGKHEHDHCHKEEECCCHCHHGHHEECCNHCHHGHHHGFIHEWGYEEGGEHHGHIGCEDCHHCHEHCHEHSHHDQHHHQNHCHHEPDCCCGWGKKHSLPDSPIAFHCRDIIEMKDKKVLKRFCLPVGYAGFSLPYQQAYPSVGLNLWGWGSTWTKNKILGNNATNTNKTKEIKKSNKNEKSLKQKRNIYVDYDGNREENFIRGYQEACNGDVCPFYNENSDLLQRRSGIVNRKEDEIPYERGITKRYFQGSFEDGMKSGVYVSVDQN